MHAEQVPIFLPEPQPACLPAPPPPNAREGICSTAQQLVHGGKVQMGLGTKCKRHLVSTGLNSGSTRLAEVPSVAGQCCS